MGAGPERAAARRDAESGPALQTWCFGMGVSVVIVIQSWCPRVDACG